MRNKFKLMVIHFVGYYIRDQNQFDAKQLWKYKYSSGILYVPTYIFFFFLSFHVVIIIFTD